MAQVSGVWVWNDTLPFVEAIIADYNVTFKSNNDNYTSLYVYNSAHDPKGGALLAYGAEGYAVYIGSGNEIGFTNEAYKTIDFGTTPQTVSDSFYTYLTTNATTTQTEQKSISLSNLEKFKELCDQTYAKIGEGGGLTVININTGTSSGTLNSDDFAKVQANPQNVVFYGDEDIYQLDSYEESTPYYQYRRIVPNAAKNGFYDNILRIGSGGAWTFAQNTISGGGTQLYRQTMLSGSGTNSVTFVAITITSNAYAEIQDIINDIHAGNVVALFCYLSNDATRRPVLDLTTDSAYVCVEGSFKQYGIILPTRMASVTPL